jgi:MFS family permease
MKNVISRRNWTNIWIIGLAGQLCWNVENQLFNTFVYSKIAPSPEIVAWMVGFSAFITTVSTFWMGTLSDRMGRRKPFIAWGYVLWGIMTIAFGATQFVPKSPLIIAAVAVVATDAIMSFFGSMGNDSGFSTWTTDISSEENRGQLGAVIAAQPVIATVVGTIGCAALIEIFDYFVFFIVFGTLVSLIGVYSLFAIRESGELKPNADPKGALHQLLAFFRFRVLFQNRELTLVIAAISLFFISFNVYFPYMMIYFQYTLGFSLSMAGILMAVPLLIAVLIAFSLSRFLNHGRIPQVFCFAIIANFLGLMVMQAAAMIMQLLGILLMGIGYITVMQCMTAWMKNLYPDDKRGQFEGVRIIASVLLPMVIGPWIGSVLIARFGVDTAIQYDYGTAMGRAPTARLFLFAGFVALTALIPLFFAAKRYFAGRTVPPIPAGILPQERFSGNAPILNRDGTLKVRGYATDGHSAAFNRKQVKTRLRLKEWDFYQVQNEVYVLQMTIGHVSYVGSASLMLFRLDGTHKTVAEQLLILPLNSLKMPVSPESGDVTYHCKDFEIAFRHEGSSSRLTARSLSPKYDFEVDFTLSGFPAGQDAMVICTPFYETNEFYYNYKLTALRSNGHARFGGHSVDFSTPTSYGLLDWGRGIWPFRHEWYWGSAGQRTGDHVIGLNIGWGFGNTLAATENMIFYDGKGHKLHGVFLERFDPDMKTWRFTSNDGHLSLTFETLYNRITENKVLWIDNHCDQVFGKYSGTLTLDDGQVIEVKDMYGFFEHARNRW